MILKCRSCDSLKIKNVVSLGFVPLANALLTEDQLDQPEEKFPLDLVFCEDCKLVQIVETVPAEKLFKSYVYLSSMSQTMLESSRELVEGIIKELGLGPEKGTVLEIGSNDGYLLKNYVKAGVKCIGVEPAQNIATVARDNGVHTITGFFNLDRAKELVKSGYQVDVLHANNVLAHVEDLNSVIAGIAVMLKPDGVAIVETHYVGDLIEKTQFDCIYHEHLCYYSATSISNLFAKHGLTMVKAERIAIHGGSLRAYFKRTDYLDKWDESPIIVEEKAKGMQKLAYYDWIGPEIMRLKMGLQWFVQYAKNTGKKLAAYGATAKSTTLLNFCGVGKESIEFIADSTPFKQGKYAPGTHIPIVEPSEIYNRNTDILLLTAWNFAEEIEKKESRFLEKGGKMFSPFSFHREGEWSL